MVLKKGLLFAMMFYFILVSPSFSKQGESRIISEVKTIINHAVRKNPFWTNMMEGQENPETY